VDLTSVSGSQTSQTMLMIVGSQFAGSPAHLAAVGLACVSTFHAVATVFHEHIMSAKLCIERNCCVCLHTCREEEAADPVHGHITSLAVARTHRKMGIAAKLMTATRERRHQQQPQRDQQRHQQQTPCCVCVPQLADVSACNGDLPSGRQRRIVLCRAEF
jgi:GNAT superfamily N-acetyltransferase